jgi:hypothetical protein
VADAFFANFRVTQPEREQEQEREREREREQEREQEQEQEQEQERVRTARRCKLILQRTQAKFREGGVLTYALIHAQPWDEEHHSRDLFQLAEQGAPLVQFV